MTDKLDSSKEPSKGAKRATVQIVDWAEAFYLRNARTHFGGFELAELIDRETKSPQLANLLLRLMKLLERGDAEWRIADQITLTRYYAEAERLLTDLYPNEEKGP